MLNTKDFLASQAFELRRPWKLTTLAVGILLLVIGSKYFKAMDWDIPISFIMAILAYAFAPACMRIMLERRWRLFPMMLVLTWVTVDGCYWLYWHFRNPQALTFMRKANFTASLALFGLCGMLWLFQGTIREFFFELREQFKQSKTPSP